MFLARSTKNGLSFAFRINNGSIYGIPKYAQDGMTRTLRY